MAIVRLDKKRPFCCLMLGLYRLKRVICLLFVCLLFGTCLIMIWFLDFYALVIMEFPRLGRLPDWAAQSILSAGASS